MTLDLLCADLGVKVKSFPSQGHEKGEEGWAAVWDPGKQTYLYCQRTSAPFPDYNKYLEICL